MAGGQFRIYPQHGNQRVVVRGTVYRIRPVVSHWYDLILDVLRWFFGGGRYPIVYVRIDDEPFHKLLSKADLVDQLTKITWGSGDALPKVGDRAWITFAFAGQLEQFFNKAPAASLVKFELLRDEKETRPDELLDEQLPLPLPCATP